MAVCDPLAELIVKKEDPLRFIVGEAYRECHSYITFSPVKMEALNILRGDIVLIKGKRNRHTVCKAVSDERCPINMILMTLPIRENLFVKLEDFVYIELCLDPPFGKWIWILPLEDSEEELPVNLKSAWLAPYFLDMYRPVHKGDVFSIQKEKRIVNFEVIDTYPRPYCIVGPETVIHSEGEWINCTRL